MQQIDNFLDGKIAEVIPALGNLFKLESLRPLFIILGLLSVAGFFFNFLSAFWRYFLRPGKNLKKFGEWAVVTGATDGIGEAMAKELAKKGLNIIIVSRNSEKFEWTYDKVAKKEIKGSSLGFGLDLAKKAIKETRGCENIQVETVNVDFKNFDQAAKDLVAEKIKGKKIGVLVNNVGESYDHCEYFHNLQDKKVGDLLKMNVDSAVWMTKIVMSQMIKGDEKGSGAVVNIGSGSSLVISPLLAEYVGCKAFVEKMSRAMNYEYASKGIHVQCQSPMMVATKLSKVKKASLFTPDPKVYAKAAIAAIGYESVCSPYWPHAFQIWALNCLPDWIHSKIVYDMHVNIRKRALKKSKEN